MVKEKFTVTVAKEDFVSVKNFCDDILYLFTERNFNYEDVVGVIETVYGHLCNVKDVSNQNIVIWEDEYEDKD